MSNLDAGSQIGKNNETGTDLARFKVKFSGMVLAAFKRKNIMRQFVWEKNTRGSQAASFPAVGLASSSAHITKGKDIFDDANNMLSQVKVNDILVKTDRPLVSASQVDLVDDLMSDDVQLMHIAEALAETLARNIDRKIFMAGLQGARANANITATSGYETIFGGSVLKKGATVATTQSVLLAAIQEAAKVFDQHDAPAERYCFLSPAAYHLLLSGTTILGAEYGRQEVVEGRALDVHGIKVLMSNNIPSTLIPQSHKLFGIEAASGCRNVYHGDYLETVGLCMAGRQSIGGAILRDVTTWSKLSDEERLAHLLKVDFIGGFSYLRPECLIEINSNAATVEFTTT